MNFERPHSTETTRDPDLAGTVAAMLRAARGNQFLASFMCEHKSALTGTSYMEARGKDFLKLVRDSERLSGRRPLLEQMGDATKFTIYAARYAGG